MSSQKHAVVTAEEAKQIPYPYVWLNDDGIYRELTNEEREYLQTEFSPADGARPYVKFGLYSKTPDGKVGGFLERRQLPNGVNPEEPIPLQS